MDLSEEFHPIAEYPEYLVSKDGRVYSKKSKRLLKTPLSSNGYPRVIVTTNLGVSKHLMLHRVLARVFKDLPSLDSHLEVDHNDTNKLNFSLDNLIVRTKEEHRVKTTKERNQIVHNPHCITCGRLLQNRDSSECKPCSNISRRKPIEITAKDIEYWVLSYSWVRAAKELGLSDNGLRKRYKSLTGKEPKEIKSR